MHCPPFTNFAFSNYFEHPENSGTFYDKKKIAWISGIAIASLAIATWQVIEDNPWAAVAITVGGICLEIALLILYPSRTPINEIDESLDKIHEILDTSPAKEKDAARSPAPTVSESDASKDVPPTEKDATRSPASKESELDASKEVPPELKAKKASTIAISKNSLLTEKLSSVIDQLEECYPVKAIDPVKIQDQQKGGIMGQACGDAIGLFTEFTTRAEAQEMMDGQHIDLGAEYPPKFKYGHNWGHIKRFIKNGWTDDTDQALSLLRALYKRMKCVGTHASVSFELLFAFELKEWREGGFKTEGAFIGRENPYCMGLGALVGAVLKEPDFLKYPQQTAEDFWAKDREKPLQNRPAANGALMRTAPIGIIFYRSLADVVGCTIDACKVTHADPRCTASCVALTLAIALALRGYESDTLFKVAEEGGLAVLHQELNLAAEKKLLSEEEIKGLDELYESTAKDFKAHLDGTWETLDLDEGWMEKGKINKIGYTFKCLGAAFYTLRLADQYQKEGKPDVFRTIIEEIAAEGGDADTNGAAAGALLGAYLGYKGQFPSNWTDNLADKPAMEQAIQHIEEIAAWHQKNLDS